MNPSRHRRSLLHRLRLYPLLLGPKIHLDRLDTTRHVRLCRAVLFQHGGLRRSSSACVYKFSVLCFERQWRRAIEALEARAPPDGVATLVNSLQNRV